MTVCGRAEPYAMGIFGTCFEILRAPGAAIFYRTIPKCLMSARCLSSLDARSTTLRDPALVSISWAPLSVIRPVDVAREQTSFLVKWDWSEVW